MADAVQNAPRKAFSLPRMDAGNLSEIGLAAGVVAILVVMILPLPTFLLDILLAFNITFALVILLTAMYTLKPLDFSVFPSVLLITTLFRLSLNVASTRLVLLHGDDGHRGRRPGHQGLRQVRGGRQLLRRPGRLPHPGDHQLRRHHQGRRAHRRGGGPLHLGRHARQADGHRRRPERRAHRRGRGARAAARSSADEADFYGSMDGASKFVRGDAIAGIIITSINIIGGFVVGMLQKGMDFATAGRHLHHADHRRRSGQPDPGPDHHHRGRHHGQPRRQRPLPGARVHPPVLPAAQGHRHRRRHRLLLRPGARPAPPGLHGARAAAWAVWP